MLITGSSGFVASQLIKLNPKISFQKYNRTSLNNDFDVFGVIHCAGLAHQSHNKNLYSKYFKSNYDLTKVIFDNFINSKSKIFIFLSSSTVYDGLTSKNKKITENMIGDELSVYAKSKLSAEKYLMSKKNDKKVFIIRTSIITGIKSNQKGNMSLLLNLIKKKFLIPIISNSDGFLWISVSSIDSYGFPWISMNSLDLYRFPWIPMIPMDFYDFHGTSD